VQTTSPSDMSATIDWEAAEQVADRLGMNTRRLVSLGDPDAAIEWALRMSREYTGIAALSYYELAVILGHREPKVTAGATLEWRELLRSVETLAATVKEKVAAEQAAAAERAAAEEAARSQLDADDDDE
jgi:hypothetical protein